jgi:adenine-specific DNA-methyltransferase
LPNETQREETINQEKERLHKESGFDLEAAEKRLKEFTSGRQIKPFFLWSLYFSEVFHNKGGFDVVIANPPYGAELPEEEKKYLKERHEPIVERIRNTFLYFLGEAYNQSRENGVVCFILPNELLFQIYMTKARRFFLENSQVLFAINLGEAVFEAVVPSCVICIMKVKLNDYEIPVSDLRKATLEDLPKLLVMKKFPITTKGTVLSAPNFIFSFNEGKAKLINRLASSFEPFETFCDDVANGISTGCDKVYIVSETFAIENRFEKEHLKECIRGGQFNRFYCPEHTHEYVLYITGEFNCRISENVYLYLSKNRELLVQKSVEKKQGKREWHVLFRSRYEGLFTKPKILFRQTGDRVIAAIDKETGYYCIDSVNVAQVKPKYHVCLEYFIGLLNSRLMVFYYQETSQEKGRVLAQVKPQRIRSLPIIMGTLQQREQITSLVNQIQTAKQSSLHVNTSALEQDIEHLVYQLYGLTEEEIRIVEGKGK